MVSALIEGVEEVMEDLRPWGIHLHSAGGETADLGDVVRTIAFDCTLTTRIKRYVLGIYVYRNTLAPFLSWDFITLSFLFPPSHALVSCFMDVHIYTGLMSLITATLDQEI